MPEAGDIVFETPRLIVRRFRHSDLDALAALYADPEIRRYFPGGTLGREETREELEWFLDETARPPDIGLRAIVERRSGALAGRGGLLSWTIDGQTEIETAYLIERPRWRQGLGGEFLDGLVRHAFGTLGLKRLIALIDGGNIASIRTAEKSGFRFERGVRIEGTPARLHALAAGVP